MTFKSQNTDALSSRMKYQNGDNEMPEVKNKKDPLCPKCINWDPRQEGGLWTRTGYCLARDIVTSIRYECEFFEMATIRLREKRKKEIYGEYFDNEEHIGH